MDKFAYLKALRADENIPAEIRLTNAEFRLLVMIWNYCDNECRNAHPSADRLASDTGVTKRLVWRQLKSLKTKGYLDVTTAGGARGAGAKKANTYALTLPSAVVELSTTTKPVSSAPQDHYSVVDPRTTTSTPCSGAEVHPVVDPSATTSSGAQVHPNKPITNQEQSAGPEGQRKTWRQILAEQRSVA